LGNKHPEIFEEENGSEKEMFLIFSIIFFFGFVFVIF
jgi:hypothetical protein